MLEDGIEAGTYVVCVFLLETDLDVTVQMFGNEFGCAYSRAAGQCRIMPVPDNVEVSKYPLIKIRNDLKGNTGP